MVIKNIQTILKYHSQESKNVNETITKLQIENYSNFTKGPTKITLRSSLTPG